MAHVAGGMVEGAEDSSEYGKIEVYARNNILFTDIPSKSVCWMSHHDYIPHPPKGFTTIAITDKCPTAAPQEKTLHDRHGLHERSVHSAGA